ncbi:hypothetical protein roselon_02631 [Roseibacterium elongatum DSM 19469]|uniref:DNA-binding protein HU n=1 Tax=Roseicyclus elongatus DSM 19469 TaxID=1294273 RepID=W8SR16_9RHOB|nr:HU family DNA-binding protein [Roseibacterium elongatum]AHM04945.1 hypothetical protein roselon_02631 [Roseibacterium elongatum DSM 19469]
MQVVPKNDATPPAIDETASKTSAETPERAKRPDLLDAIVARSDMKRSDVKLVMDLVLAEMGTLLDAHDELAVSPLGKLMVKKRVEKPGGALLTVKLKRTGPQPGPSAATEAPGEADPGADEKD